MTLDERYLEFLHHSELGSEKNITKDEVLKSYRAHMDAIEKGKDFKVPTFAKLDDDYLKSFDDRIKEKLESKHSAFEALGNVILDEFKAMSQPQIFPNVIFRVLPENELNAYAVKVPEGFLILIDSALSIFYLLLSSILCRSKEFQVALFNEEIGETLTQNEIVENIGILFKNYLVTGEISDDMVRRFGITPKDGLLFEVEGLLYKIFIFYVVAHELSHVYSKDHYFDSTLGAILKENQLYSHFSQSTELRADNLAFQVLIKRKNRPLWVGGPTWNSVSENPVLFDMHLFLLYSSITIYFISVSWFDKIEEDYKRKTTGKDEKIKYDNKSHPPDLLRQLKFMENWMDEYSPKNKYMFIKINSILAEIEKDVISVITKLLL